MFHSIITGTGCYIPTVIQKNIEFAEQVFYSMDQQPLTMRPQEVVENFKKITGIAERRYSTDELNTSDIGAIAAQEALTDSGVNPEEIDQLIVAHNFGNVTKHDSQTVTVPTIASLIKHQLGIRNPGCIAYDVLFGCPGWVLAIIQADAFFKAGLARKALIIGADTLSRVIDVYDRDSMIFSDGAGAAVLEYRETGELGSGLLTSSIQTHSSEDIDYIYMGQSFYPGTDSPTRYLKMNGHKVYEFALKYVPVAMKDCLDKSGVDIRQLKMVFIHQANEKMDESIIKRLYQLYGISTPPEHIMPMSIHWLGNSSVATVPSLYDLVRKEKVTHHQLIPGDVILFASVGAGMNVNAVCYRY